MSTHVTLKERFQSLPPALPEPTDRFEQVAARVKRRRLRRVAGTVAVGVGIVAITMPVVLAGNDEQSTRGVDPATSSSTPSIDVVDTSVAPGGTLVTQVGPVIEGHYTGTATIAMGPPPPEATAIAINLQCRSAGRFTYPGLGSTACNHADGRSTRPADAMPLNTRLVIALPKGHTDFTIDTTAGARWDIVASYVTTEVTEWGINDNGQTYGVQNENGSPDLVRVAIEGGAIGYAYAEQLNNPTGLPDPQTPQEALEYTKATKGRTYKVPVYDLDGSTQIGTFTIG